MLIGDGQRLPALMERLQREQLHNVVFCDPVNKTRLAGRWLPPTSACKLLANVPAFYYGTSPNQFFDFTSPQACRR